MSSEYTSLQIEKIGVGEKAGTWGGTTNQNWDSIGQAITGSTDIDFAGNATYALDMTAQDNTSQPARCLRLNILPDGADIGTRSLRLGANLRVDKFYLIDNQIADDPVSVVNYSGGDLGTAVTIPAGKASMVFSDGTDVREVYNIQPTIDLTADVTGILPEANGGTTVGTLSAGMADWFEDASSANLAGTLTDYTGTGLVMFNKNPLVETAREQTTVSSTAATGTVTFDAITQSVLFYTTNASGNWTLNVRGDGSNTLNSMMSTGQTMTLVFLVQQGSTAYYQTGFQIDGSSVTPKWQGGAAPTGGNASSIDAYAISIIKTGAATFTVFESQTLFA